MAIKYMETNRITEGYTSLLYKTPDEDVGFFYRNLKTARHELETMPATATQLEKTNTLMKLRETLTVSGEHGEYLAVPSGLSWYPFNWALVLVILAGFLSLVIGIILILWGLND